MEGAHVHLLLNHVPLVGNVIGLVLVVVGRWRRSRELTGAGLALLVIGGLLVVPTYLTGEAAEEAVEHLPGVIESVIERHEDAALNSLVATIVTGAMALVALVLGTLRMRAANMAIAATLALSLISLAVTANVANLGGQIRHSEIRAGGPQPATDAEVDAQKSENRHDDD